jgi:hypothetical protein
MRSQTGKPPVPLNPLSYPPTLEGNNGIPQDQRHPPPYETAGTQKRPKHHELHAARKLEESDQYHSATAKSIEETAKLVKTGFEYVITIDNIQLFRKRK